MTATLDLYLIRHGLAGEFGSYADDTLRPLTTAGQHKTRQVADRLANLGLQFGQILTSPLLRAQQTAEILQAAGLCQQVATAECLATGDFDRWLNWWATWHLTATQPLALVGHEPSLSQWAELLVWGRVNHAIRLKKAGVIGLSLPTSGSPVGQSVLFWLTPPKFLL